MCLAVKPAGKNLHELVEKLVGEVDIDDFAAFTAVKVRVLGQIWAVAGRLALEIDLADEFCFCQCLEAIVDRREGNCWHILFCADVNLFRGGMIAFLQEERINVLALLCRTLATKL